MKNFKINQILMPILLLSLVFVGIRIFFPNLFNPNNNTDDKVSSQTPSISVKPAQDGFLIHILMLICDPNFKITDDTIGSMNEEIKYEFDSKIYLTSIKSVKPVELGTLNGADAIPNQSNPTGVRYLCQCKFFNIEISVVTQIASINSSKKEIFEKEKELSGKLIEFIKLFFHSKDVYKDTEYQILDHDHYEVGPDHKDIGNSESEIKIKSLSDNISSGNKLLIAVLDTSNSPDYLLDGKKVSDNSDLFINEYEGKEIKGFGRGHGFPIIELIHSTLDSKNLEIKPYQVCNKKGICLESDILNGICSAVKYAYSNNYTSKLDKEGLNLVFNLSFGSINHSPILQKFIEAAIDVDKVLFSASAGNFTKYNDPNGNLISTIGNVYPAFFSHRGPGLVSTGSLKYENSNLILAENSEKGNLCLANSSCLSVSAPGRKILSIDPNGAKRYYSGTSFATPIVTSALALLRSRGWDIEKIISCINSYVKNKNEFGIVHQIPNFTGIYQLNDFNEFPECQ